MAIRQIASRTNLGSGNLPDPDSADAMWNARTNGDIRNSQARVPRRFALSLHPTSWVSGLGFRVELVGRKGLTSFSRQYRLTSGILALGLLCSL